MLHATSNFVAFKLQNRTQDMIESRALNAEAAAQFKAALQQVDFQEGILQLAQAEVLDFFYFKKQVFQSQLAKFSFVLPRIFAYLCTYILLTIVEPNC